MEYRLLSILQVALLFSVLFPTVVVVNGASLSKNLTEDLIASTITPDVKGEDDNSTRVTIYTWSHFLGIPWVLTLQNCTDVPPYFYKKTSSINTHENCVVLYSRQECEGRHVLIAPGTDGHSQLSVIDFDDTLASLKPCSEDDTLAQDLNKIEDEPIESDQSGGDAEKHKAKREAPENDAPVEMEELPRRVEEPSTTTGEDQGEQEGPGQGEEESNSNDDDNNDGQGEENGSFNGDVENIIQQIQQRLQSILNQNA